MHFSNLYAILSNFSNGLIVEKRSNLSPPFISESFGWYPNVYDIEQKNELKTSFFLF